MPLSPRLLRPIASGFNPKSIAGLKLWLDASDSSTVTLNGSAVSQWGDKSGNGFHFSQSTANNQPAYTGSINGRSAISFDGVNDGLDRTGVTNANIADTTGACAFAVYEISGTDLQYAVLRTLTTGSGHDRFNSTGYHCYFRTSRFLSIPNPPPSTGLVLLTSSSNVSSDTQSVRVNGAQYQSQVCATTFAAWRALTGQAWAVGYDASWLTGSVGEVLIYGKALSATDISKVEKYLAAKWGVTVA